MTVKHARWRRVVIVGGGFAGFHAARALSRLTTGLDLEVVLVNPTDYFLYLPLLPEVAVGIPDPRRVSVPLAATLPGVRLVLGTVERIDLDAPGRPSGPGRPPTRDGLRPAAAGHWQRPPAAADPRGRHPRPRLPQPREALWLRDHLVCQLELAASCDDPAERAARCTLMTAQHAQRQGDLAATNLAASLGHSRAHPYRHHDLGFVVDLGGAKAAANPLGVPLSGVVAKTVTRGYHLAVIPANRVRIAADWLLDAVLPRQTVQLSLVRSPSVPLGSAARAGGTASQARS